MTASLALKAASGGSITVTPIDTAGDYILSIPAVTGNMLVNTVAPSVSTTNTVTNKIKISISGVDYYLLASTSGT
jgi:hypothetical protein